MLDFMEKEEIESVDRVGRRLSSMLEAVKAAKNIAKPVQLALSEALDALKQATKARKLRLAAKKRPNLMKEESLVVGSNTPEANDSVLSGIRAISSKLVEHGEKIEAINGKLDSCGGNVESSDQQAQTSRWTDMVRKKPKSNVPGKTVVNPPIAISKPVEGKRRGVRTRPPAIMVDVKPEEYPALARKIRGGVDRGIIGDSVTGMRQAKSGGLLIEVRGDQARIEAVRSEISHSAGKEVEVRALQQKVMVEVRDLDQWSTVEEVAEASAAETGISSEQIRVFNLRRRFESSQSALVLLPTRSSRALLNSGRLFVGMVSCRVKLADQKQRCFRCFCPGHTAKECSGPDRSECCRRCGESGHKVAVAARPHLQLVSLPSYWRRRIRPGNEYGG